MKLCHLLLVWSLAGLGLAQEQTCSVNPLDDEQDPALKLMTYDVGDGEQTMMAYVTPDISTFYQGNPPATTTVPPKFKGLASKFINMSNRHIRLYWEAHKGGEPNLIRFCKPFSTGGTASFPGHMFFFAADEDPIVRLQDVLVKQYPENIYVYDPYLVEGDPEQTEENLKALSASERELYDMWVKTLRFNEQYKNFTGRSYLANYLRPPPSHYMWRADYFGQEHWVTTKETHFAEVPPANALGAVESFGESRILKDKDNRLLSEYRVPEPYMNMTLKVLSCAPRVFEIQNFLSKAEVEHVLELAGGYQLKESTTGDVGAGDKAVDHKYEQQRKTRTSLNSWVHRERSPVIDAIYRRSADLLRINEALLRQRSPDEIPGYPSKRTIAESLQLVHYDLTQEYTAHHDFGYSAVNDPRQGARFSTLLFYLNEGMVGGETSFPRWQNAETFEQLKVAPEAGKAVLFYSQLPDGNMDDFSQHAALPVKEGEKWLINLWVWEPLYER